MIAIHDSPSPLSFKSATMSANQLIIFNSEHVYDWMSKVLMNWTMVIKNINPYIVRVNYWFMMNWNIMTSYDWNNIYGIYGGTVLYVLYVFLFLLFPVYCLITRDKSVLLSIGKYGFRVMSCSHWNCNQIAVYGSKRGRDTAIRCIDHKSDDMVKAFGCNIPYCKGRVVRTSLLCKKHM